MKESSPNKISPEEAKIKIMHEQICTGIGTNKQVVNTLHYSVCKKEAATCSFLSNERLLILNEKDGSLYYVNEAIKFPFKNEACVPKPKNDYAHINFCIAKQENPDSSTLTIMFNKKGKDDKLECIEWKFIMNDKKLTQDWECLIRDKKMERMAKVVGIDVSDKTTLGTLQDTLSFGLMGNPKAGESSKKVEDSDEKAERKGFTNFLLNQEKKVKEKGDTEPDFYSFSPSDGNSPEKEKRSSSNSPGKSIDQKYFNNKTIIEEPDEYENELTTRTKEKSKEEAQKEIQGEEGYRNPDDWNLRFLKNPSEATIKAFEEFALEEFKSLKVDSIKFQDSFTSDSIEKPIVILKNCLNIFLAPIQSVVARYLKEEFLNYSYIIESCRDNNCIRVPLSCVIEQKGVLALMRASFPEEAKVIERNKATEKTPFAATLDSLFREFESHTKVRSEILKKSCVILNLTVPYGLSDGLPRIYIDEISEFLPYHPKLNNKNTISLTQFSIQELVRPELILDNFTRVIDTSPTENQTIQELDYYVEESVKELVELLINQEKIVAGLKDLEEIMNYYGLSITCLPGLYYTLDIRCKKDAVKHVRKLLQTSLAALLVLKIDINPTIEELRESGKSNLIEEGVEGVIRKYCEGGSALSSESWKKLTLEFKKAYDIPMISHEIEPSLFLSCLMELTFADFDMSKLNKSKKLLEDKQIISAGFIKKIKPKVLSYNSYISKETESLVKLCQDNEINNFNKISELHSNILLDSQLRANVLLGTNNDKFLAYTSKYISPSSKKYSGFVKEIVKETAKEPPTLASHTTTINYLHLLLLDLIESPTEQLHSKYKESVERYMSIVKYWLGDEFPYLCDIYYELSEYYFLFHKNSEESLKFLKDSMIISRRSCGQRNHRTALKYFKLGERQLSLGYKREAKENLYAAKDILEDQVDQRASEYAILLNMIARLELSNGNIDTCIIEAEKSLSKIEKLTTAAKVGFETISNSHAITKVHIDNYIILSRAFEIQGNGEELRKISNSLGKLLEHERDPMKFDEILKICMVGIIYGLSDLKISKLKQFIDYHKLHLENELNSSEESMPRKLPEKEQRIQDKNKSRGKLVQESKYLSIVDKMTSRIDNIDRIVEESIRFSNDLKPEPAHIKEFRTLWHNVIECVGGTEFVVGIIEEIEGI